MHFELVKAISRLLYDINKTKLIIYLNKIRHAKTLQGGCKDNNATY